jgi:hypothetical protein
VLTSGVGKFLGASDLRLEGKGTVMGIGRLGEGKGNGQIRKRGGLPTEIDLTEKNDLMRLKK